MYGQCDSQLEKRFLDVLRHRGFRRPDKAQYRVPGHYSQPDFFYSEGAVCVFIDGPPHDEPEQAQADSAIRESLERDGYKVLVFHHQKTDWHALIRAHPAVFGVEGAGLGANP
jgi:very-short-patch-repair endonuclease